MTQHSGFGRVRLVSAMVAACLPLCGLLSACTPSGAAVGDSRSAAAVDHDSIDRPDVRLGFIGSMDLQSDARLLKACSDAGLKTTYIAVTDVHDPFQAARRGLEDLAGQAVNGVVINRLQWQGTQTDAWNRALGKVRAAGIAVVLVDPIDQPKDERLFAARLTVDNHSGQAVPMDAALMSIVNANPHKRDLIVKTQ
ncbi:hypothetical protein CRD60_03535 [Bifidobacterium aemilianum]|uniref:Sugar ABC transporter substrate-binding protein n=1 Tax=Bifidobacterium aemilianum TaxID=2493120 RepID=A0A366K970_9BIFI|nr:sugar ABC transporter substrate-binding protein [Bifidobacterium aemilianum]RBP98219.1 hypothetical protein CRD60_03535 [Bifidobacterium aemilianum]